MWLAALVVVGMTIVVGPWVAMAPFASMEACLIAFLPAVVSGYFSLSDRGALLAFWYPAVLWMVAILDRPNAEIEGRTTVVLVCVLAALFVGFFRARETRRVALWQTGARAQSFLTSSGSERLAVALTRTVLRQSPMRALAEGMWMALLAGTALLVTVSVSPHLWQKESADHGLPSASGAASQGNGNAGTCCPESLPEEHERERIREYFPLHTWQDKEKPALAKIACVSCPRGAPNSDPVYGSYPLTNTGTADYSLGSLDTGAGISEAPAAITPTATPIAAPAVIPPATPTVAPTAKPTVPPPVKPIASSPAAAPTAPPSHVAAPPVAPVVVPAPANPAGTPGRPWESVLGLAAIGLLGYLGARALRRQLMLRHLERPLWNEKIDQRVSNSWQLMLIGLRDAGWYTLAGEQPRELARRVNIEGVETCATLLERARHGVRVDTADLHAMEASARAVYRAARRRAGVTARVFASVRWPLA